MRDQPTDRIRTYDYKRHVFGAKILLTCVNFALHKTGDEKIKLFSQSKKCIRRNFFMDGFGKSVGTTMQDKTIYKEIVWCVSNRVFGLSKWVSSSPVMNKEFLPENCLLETYKRLKIEPVNSSILFWLNWNVENDSIEVSRGPQKKFPSSINKSAVLSLVSSVFDPLSLYAPFTMGMWMLLKSIWQTSGQ